MQGSCNQADFFITVRELFFLQICQNIVLNAASPGSAPLWRINNRDRKTNNLPRRAPKGPEAVMLVFSLAVLCNFVMKNLKSYDDGKMALWRNHFRKP
jgi:hypothetical protein